MEKNNLLYIFMYENYLLFIEWMKFEWNVVWKVVFILYKSAQGGKYL